MIQGTYYKEWSSVLNREMEFKVYGHGGVPVLALPARGGRFYDWENNGMPDAIAQLLNEGKVQLFCADSVDGEGVLNGDLPLRRRNIHAKVLVNHCAVDHALVNRLRADEQPVADNQ